jgi:hypothetical protein
MSTITKPRINLFAALGSFFNTETIDIPEEVEMPEELKNTLKSLKNKEVDVERAINVVNNSSKKGGFGKKINPNTEKAMRAMLNKEENKNLIEDRERE